LREVPSARRQELGAYLQRAGHDRLAWLHQLEHGHYESAARTLESLGRSEEGEIGLKKTMLSLAKLSALASEEPEESALSSAERQLEVVLAQEQLPKSLLSAHGLLDEEGRKKNVAEEASKVRVLSPRELIEVRIYYNGLN